MACYKYDSFYVCFPIPQILIHLITHISRIKLYVRYIAMYIDYSFLPPQRTFMCSQD